MVYVPFIISVNLPEKGNAEIKQILRFAPKIKITALERDNSMSIELNAIHRAKGTDAERLPKQWGRESALFTHNDGYQIMFTVKKTLMSVEHRDAFFKSLEWPDNDGTILLQKSCNSSNKRESLVDIEESYINNEIMAAEKESQLGLIKVAVQADKQ